MVGYVDQSSAVQQLITDGFMYIDQIYTKQEVVGDMSIHKYTDTHTQVLTQITHIHTLTHTNLYHQYYFPPTVSTYSAVSCSSVKIPSSSQIPHNQSVSKKIIIFLSIFFSIKFQIAYIL